ncbi:uncharacterized protein LOC117666666 [Pantherophis guttatus]|uniref:Uncharacterized protein LOC117666666 n=1 Tax=Pantherophis guttatus TaxID=94885 RepID=A0A6P9BV07_PANGU|nr:uncharacterized protein LOC117666666 [Pantherophis guttatus]
MEEEKKPMEGAAGTGSATVPETLYSPSPGMVEAKRAAEAARQLGARPKEQLLKRSLKQDLVAQGEASSATPLRGAMWEPQWELLQPPRHRHSKEWGLLPQSRTQSLAGLPEQLSRLRVSGMPQHASTKQPEWTLAQPTSTFPSQGPAAQWAETAMTFHSVPSCSTPGLSLQVSPAVDSHHLGLQPLPASQAGHGVPIQPQGAWNLQLPPEMGFSPASQIPPGWAYYPGHGWIQCQWMPASMPPQMQFLQQEVHPQPQAAIPQQVLVNPQQVQDQQPALATAPPTFCATFDGTPGKLAYFLNQVWAYSDQFGNQYPSDCELISAIAEGMNEGEAAEWIAELHNERAPELEDMDDFIQLMRVRFSNVTQQVEAEHQITTLRQAGRPAKEFVWEFQRLAGKLRDWPEQLMVHTFKEALDPDLRQACSIRGTPTQIQAWYENAVALDLDFQPPRKPTAEKMAKQPLGRRVEPKKTAEPPPARPGTIKCYRCGQQGHRALECLAPAPLPWAKSPARAGPKKTLWKPLDKGQSAKQAAESSTQPAGLEGSLTGDSSSLSSEEDSGEDDPRDTCFF